MQKINIKKYTKEQMLKMLEEAAEKQEAAEAEASAHFKDGVKLAEENEKLRGEIGALTEKLEENEKALEVHGEDMKAIEKAKNESRELAKQLGERMVELKAAEENARKAAVEMNSIRAQLSEAETHAKRKEELLCGGAAHDQDREKHQGGLSQEPQVVHGASVAQRVALHERVFPLLTNKERERRRESDVPIQKERAGEL